MNILLDYQAIKKFSSWDEVFGCQRPLKVDIGCGKAPFIIQCAEREPETHFIGIESDGGVALQMERKVRHSGVKNVRVVYFDGHYVLNNLFPGESVHSFFLQFPDPWPKRRHAKRRIVNEEFVKIIYSKLVPEGEFFMSTDVSYLAESAVEHFGNFPGFSLGNRIKPYPFQTLFEERFIKQGLPIHYLKYRKKNCK